MWKPALLLSVEIKACKIMSPKVTIKERAYVLDASPVYEIQ